MPDQQKSFAERIAQIEKDKGVASPQPKPANPEAARPQKTTPAPQRGVSPALHVATFVVIVCAGFAAAFIFGSPEYKARVISIFMPEFGQVKSADLDVEDRYEWDTTPTPLNAARLGMKRMNAFAQDMSDMEMDALVREANGLGQPFLANEIAREMGACETLKCRQELQNKYEAQLTKLRKSTPTW